VYDLHIHTRYSSDGQHDPAALVEMAGAAGLRGIAFTDHMDVTAARESRLIASTRGVRLFTGVEISTVFEGEERHLLLYGFEPSDRVLGAFLEETCRRAWERAHEVIEVFTGMGFSVGAEDVDGWGSSMPTGVSLLDALLRRNRHDPRLAPYLEGPKASSPYMSFYQDYALGDVGEIVRRALPGLVDTMRLLAGRGILVLAHPCDIPVESLERLVPEGLRGIEAYSTHHTGRQELRLVEAARTLGLWVSAGSDFHGERIKPGIRLGGCTGQPDAGLVEALMALSGS